MEETPLVMHDEAGWTCFGCGVNGSVKRFFLKSGITESTILNYCDPCANKIARAITSEISQEIVDADAIRVMLNVLANPEKNQQPTVLEWMLECNRCGVNYATFTRLGNLLRELGVIRKTGTNGNINSYHVDVETWNSRM